MVDIARWIQRAVWDMLNNNDRSAFLYQLKWAGENEIRR